MLPRVIHRHDERVQFWRAALEREMKIRSERGNAALPGRVVANEGKPAKHAGRVGEFHVDGLLSDAHQSIGPPDAIVTPDTALGGFALGAIPQVRKAHHA
jgi:hypothetical protein